MAHDLEQHRRGRKPHPPSHMCRPSAYPHPPTDPPAGVACSTARHSLRGRSCTGPNRRRSRRCTGHARAECVITQGMLCARDANQAQHVCSAQGPSRVNMSTGTYLSTSTTMVREPTKFLHMGRARYHDPAMGQGLWARGMANVVDACAGDEARRHTTHELGNVF